MRKYYGTGSIYLLGGGAYGRACLRILIFLIELADKSNWTESALTLTTMNPSCKGELAELSTKGRHRLSSARL